MFDFIDGNKTYLVGAAWIIYGVAGMAIGQLDQTSGMFAIGTGFALLTGRSALKKLEK